MLSGSDAVSTNQPRLDARDRDKDDRKDCSCTHSRSMPTFKPDPLSCSGVHLRALQVVARTWFSNSEQSRHVRFGKQVAMTSRPTAQGMGPQRLGVLARSKLTEAPYPKAADGCITWRPEAYFFSAIYVGSDENEPRNSKSTASLSLHALSLKDDRDRRRLSSPRKSSTAFIYLRSYKDPLHTYICIYIHIYTLKHLRSPCLFRFLQLAVVLSCAELCWRCFRVPETASRKRCGRSHGNLYCLTPIRPYLSFQESAAPIWTQVGLLLQGHLQ